MTAVYLQRKYQLIHQREVAEHENKLRRLAEAELKLKEAVLASTMNGVSSESKVSLAKPGWKSFVSLHWMLAGGSSSAAGAVARHRI